MENKPEISSKCVREENRTFSFYPSLPSPDSRTLGEEETWLELAQFVKEDLKWLLFLDYHKFWSYMIYSESAHKLLVSFLKQAPPNYLKKSYLKKEEIKNVYRDIEHLVFLVFVRLATEKESDSNKVNNLGEILYNNYLFTVPIILDICSIYGVSNRDLVKKMINTVITVAPDFWDDLQQLPPYFSKVLKTVQDKFLVDQAPRLKETSELRPNELRDLIYYLYDSVSTIQIFLELISKSCELFCKSEFIADIVFFYSNVLAEIEMKLRENNQDLLLFNLIENTRVDFLKIVKSIFDNLAQEENPLKKKEEIVDEYLTLMMELLSETLFLLDYNRMYSIEFEIESLMQDCTNVDTMKVNHILKGLALAEESENVEKVKNGVISSEMACSERDEAEVKLNSLVTEVKDILPHLDEKFITACLKHYNYSTERVIAAILENSVPNDLNLNETLLPSAQNKENHIEGACYFENKGKNQSEDETFKEFLNDRREIKEMKARYAEYGFVADDTYDDEYDDTYDENIDVAIREADDTERNRRAFVTPRVLRIAEEEDEDEEEEGEDGEKIEEQQRRKDWFVPNPAEIRERNEQRRADRGRRDVVGKPRGQGQNQQVLRNREFKGTHKSSMANHNRKKQASRKMHQGMIPS